MKLKNALFALLGLLLLSVTLDPQTAYPQQSRQIMLAGYNHEPPVSTSGSGMVTVSFNQDTLRVEGDFSDLTSRYRGAYVMVGEKGEAGNMLFRLNVEPSEDRTGGTIKAEDNAFSLNDAQKPLLKKGELYINVTSSNHAKGELRGQIPPMK
ncbi:CHRD domain-containing protein [Fodinibius sp.]|uniref:CHRD domain-containing protein n=1 Tax=Fodinibius sp. TaxID=1872440 RepID=UPI00356954AF